MPKLLYLISEDWFFCSHFIERAIAAKNAGYEVVVVANENKHAEVIRHAGLFFVPLKISRRSINPFIEMLTIIDIWRIYKSQRPDLIHHVALKPLIYGSFVARLIGIKCIVNAPVGMGYVFTTEKWLTKTLRPLINLLIRWFINPPHSKVIFENNDDLNMLINDGLVSASDAILIRGAGVDINQFTLIPEPEGALVIVLTARMLWDKGIREYVEAARVLKASNEDIRFLLVGASDPDNAASISEKQLTSWHSEGIVEWMGYQKDIPKLLSQCHIVCLPSYREGLPKSLLEALAAGKPVVTTDVPGCREVVINEFNGLLVPPRNTQALVCALSSLIANQTLRMRFGKSGRDRAEKEFSSNIVINLTLEVYSQFFNHNK